MPLYEYKCLKCGHVFEDLVRESSAKPVCSACGSKQTERKLSVFAVSTMESPPCGPRCESCPGSAKGCPYSED